MLTSHQMEKALCAIALIDAQALFVMTNKLVCDIESGRYTDDYEITPNISVGGLRSRGTWRTDIHLLAVITSMMAGQLMRIACEKVGIAPMQGTWRQLLQMGCTTTHIERVVVQQLLPSAKAA